MKCTVISSICRDGSVAIVNSHANMVLFRVYVRIVPHPTCPTFHEHWLLNMSIDSTHTVFTLIHEVSSNLHPGESHCCIYTCVFACVKIEMSERETRRPRYIPSYDVCVCVSICLPVSVSLCSNPIFVRQVAQKMVVCAPGSTKPPSLSTPNINICAPVAAQ